MEHTPRAQAATVRLHVRILALLFYCLGCWIPTAWATDGADLYTQHCAICHGERGDGNTHTSRGLDPPPPDFTTVQARSELSRERMIAAVLDGRPGTSMMAYSDRFSASDVAAVVDYIRAHYMTGTVSGRQRVGLGEQTYVHNCAVCHGDKGSGAVWTSSSLNPPPRDFTAAGSELTRERMVTSVTYGRPGTAMMSFRKRLTVAQIAAVVSYIRATFMTQTAMASDHLPEMSAEDMQAPFPNGLRGDAKAGRHFYRANCYVCHGLQGDGKGPRADFIEPKPRNFLTHESRARLNRPALYLAVKEGVRGTVMPAWGWVLSDQEVANVAEYVYTAFIRAQNGEGVKKKLSD